MDSISFVGAILGISGTLLIAFKYVRLGYLLYIPSNALLITYMLIVGSYDLAIMYVVYLSITFIGLYNWRNHSEKIPQTDTHNIDPNETSYYSVSMEELFNFYYPPEDAKHSAIIYSYTFGDSECETNAKK